jgi:hypothetical protein
MCVWHTPMPTEPRSAKKQFICKQAGSERPNTRVLALGHGLRVFVGAGRGHAAKQSRRDRVLQG